MNASDPKDFAKVLAGHKENLARIKAMLDEQTAMLQSLETEFAKLGIDKSNLPPLEELPSEYQQQYLDFTRDLKAIDEILAPSKPKTKPATMRRRNII